MANISGDEIALHVTVSGTPHTKQRTATARTSLRGVPQASTEGVDVTAPTTMLEIDCEGEDDVCSELGDNW